MAALPVGCPSTKLNPAGVWPSDGDTVCTSSLTESTHGCIMCDYVRHRGGLPYAGVQMSKAEQQNAQSGKHSLMSCLDRPVLDVQNIFICLKTWVQACVYLRVWPQVDVVFGHKAFPIVEFSCVPVRIILHVGDLEANTHVWNIAHNDVDPFYYCRVKGR